MTSLKLLMSDIDTLYDRRDELKADIRAATQDIDQFKAGIAKNEDRRRDLEAEDEYLQEKIEDTALERERYEEELKALEQEIKDHENSDGS